jgi:murein DD-endopeptidase MepM/ murein hydrolase activator NlpD
MFSGYKILASFLVILFIVLIASLPHSDGDRSRDPEEKAPDVVDKTIGIIEDIIRPGETMTDIFLRNGLSVQDLFQIREAAAGIHRLQHIVPGRPYRIEIDADNSVLSLIYQIDGHRLLTITREDPGFKAAREDIPYERLEGRIGGIVETTLVEALVADGAPVSLALQLSEIFSWDIDFTAGLRKGDVFRIVVEELWLDGNLVRYGNILAAEFVNNGKSYRAFRFETNGRVDYFDDGGRSLRKAFLKAPLSYRRISSGFTKSRLHPILKVRQPHLAVDYVAPHGTPVSALGDGTVTFAGYKGPNGNLVIIRHPMGYTTYYGHLSRFGRGIRQGARVSQGDIIGYVGATGRATGPHLCFRIRKGGKFLNPLSIDIPRGKEVPKELMAAFEDRKIAMTQAIAAITPSGYDLAQASGDGTPAHDETREIPSR